MPDVDELLAGYAETWRRAEPPPPDLADAVARIPARRRSYAPLAAAACVLAVAAVIAIPLVRADRHPDQPRLPVTAAAPIARLTTIAVTAAEGCGDRHPSAARAVHTTRAAANRLLSDAGISEQTPVWAIEVDGHFSCVTTGPPGSGPARGTVLQLVIDARTWRGTDGGISSTSHDLSKLGTVVNLIP